MHKIGVGPRLLLLFGDGGIDASSFFAIEEVLHHGMNLTATVRDLTYETASRLASEVREATNHRNGPRTGS
jgi:hypothetical protein